MPVRIRRPSNSCGTYKGRCYRHVRLNQVFPHSLIRSFWWVLDDGSHFKTLSELLRHVDASSQPSVEPAARRL